MQGEELCARDMLLACELQLLSGTALVKQHEGEAFTVACACMLIYMHGICHCSTYNWARLPGLLHLPIHVNVYMHAY